VEWDGEFANTLTAGPFRSCVGSHLAAQFKKQKAESKKVETHFSFQFSKFQLFALALCALLYAPTRLIEEANPGWRLVSWRWRWKSPG